MRRWMYALGVPALVGGLVVTAPIAASSAATFTLTVADDVADDDEALRGAIVAANANDEADTIVLEADETYTLTLDGPDEDAAATGDLDVTSDITITAEGEGATIDASELGDRAFHVLAGGSLTLVNVTVTGGTAVGAPTPAGGASGGAVLNAGTLVVEGSTFSDNDAPRAGGAVEASAGSTTTLTDTDLTDNATGPDAPTEGAPGNGGGLHLTGAGTVTVDGGTVSGNTAAAEGGGLWNSGAGTMTVSDVDITGNTASGADATQGGGGVFAEAGDGVTTITGGTINDNVADGTAGSGGGILNDQATVVVEGTAINGNTAVRAGGGVEANVGTTTLTGGTLWQNETGAGPGNGGGLHLTGAGTVEVVGVTVAENTASAEGGGLWNSAAGTMTVTGATISDNVASGADPDQGGGGLFNDGGELSVSDSTVDANVADGAAGSGGGLLTNGGTLVVSASDVTDNTAVRAGGGIEATVDGSVTEVSDVLLAGNSTGDAPGNGGGLHLTGAGTVSVTGSTVEANSATNEGGGLWNSAGGTMTVSDTTLVDNTTEGDGGGLHNDGGALEVVDSTVSGNAAAGLGGGVNAGGETPAAAEDVTLVHVTVTDNASGVSGALSIGSSIVAGNDDADGTEEVASLGGNVTGSGIAGTDDDVTDVSDPELGELADNGGATLTHLPADGSPAIDAGVADQGDDTDQRGAERPVDGGTGVVAPDSGSVEVAADGGDDDDDEDDDGRAGNDGGMAPAAPARPTGAQPTFTG